MIKSNELRVGNCVYNDKNEPVKIVCVGESIFSQWNGSDYDTVFINGKDYECSNINPIPLTPEILLKCGFENIGGGYAINVSKFKSGLEYKTLFVDLVQGIIIRQGDANESRLKDDLVSVYNTDLSGKIMLHTIQNWYFFLTQTELKIEL